MLKKITLVDVAPRDGIQNESATITTASKCELIRRIAAAGIRDIEVASFVSPKWVPQMADAADVLPVVDRFANLKSIVLAVNDKGYERAVAAGAKRIRLVVAISDSFNLKNANATTAATMESYAPIMRRAATDGVQTQSVLAVSFGCPYEGAVSPDRVFAIAAQFVSWGTSEISFADTVGMAVPTQIERMLKRARSEFGGVRLGVHLHNTRNIGLANAYAAVQAGVDVIDASTGGAGGCPFAPRATGNIPMEDLVFMLAGMGIETGVDLEALAETARWFEGTLGRALPGMVMKAGPCWKSPPPLA